ncbi:MAG: glycosyltransferase family 2 protein [Terriglobia bacterium]
MTPARNEAAFIESTIKSVVAQAVPPAKWVIVSDGSTDSTDEIVSKHMAVHPWIELVRMPDRGERHFAGKVHAFNAGYARVTGVDYDVVASLDADITFDEEYFGFLLKKFAENPRLGVAGTPFRENSRQYDYRFTNIEHVSGACQLFRRECFEEIGGYLPVKGGGVDFIAVTTARMKGWETRTFTERVCLHHRKMGTALCGGLAAGFRTGVQDYALGGHPLWEFFRTGYQMTKKPFFEGGLTLGLGYLCALVRRTERAIPPETATFIRREQIRRLRKFFSKSLRRLTTS